MKRLKILVVLSFLGSILASTSSIAQLTEMKTNSAGTQPWDHDESIEQISEHVYRFGSDGQFGAYILTDEGIIVIDGHYCGSATPSWLKAQLKERHNVPVKYVILSHDHASHTCGTEVFNDTAIAISSRNARPHMIFEKRVSAIPEITFNDEMDLHLGGVYVKLMFLGPTHSDNLIQIHIPEEKVLIAIDSAKGRNLFPDFRDMDVNNQLLVFRTLAYLPDVEIVLPGHGPTTTQESYLDAYLYLETIKMEVLELMAEGKSLQEIKSLVSESMAFEFGNHYNNMDIFLHTNIVTMYDYLFRYREPNVSIKQDDALRCIEDSTKCRTSSVVPER
jgi:glyoxylase-like metal-dependent hydrolase (beta-lactamase superfamily II)